MRRSYPTLAAVLAFALAAPPVEAQTWKGVLSAAREKAKQKAKEMLDSTGAADAGTATAAAGDGKVDVTAGPRNRAPTLTGVWVGTVIAPQATPNRHEVRIEVTERDGQLSGQVRRSVPGKPLQYSEYSLDGSIEDGIITISEVNELKTGSNVPHCVGRGIDYRFVVRPNGEMVGANGGYAYACAGNVRLSLKQISTANPELADGGADAGGGTTAAPVRPTAGAPAATPAATAEMVRNPNVTGVWAGTINQPRGNPNRYRYRLELTQKSGVVTGTARIEVPDQPLRYAVHSIEGSVDEGIITLQDKQLLRYGSENSWCNKRLVLMLKTDGTLSGDWGECSGGGQVYLSKPK